MLKHKKGFTLVELLIVIVVIGILSAMMMLSSTEAISSSRVADITNNLRNWKTATLAWYVDNIDKVKSDGTFGYGSNAMKKHFGTNGTVTILEIAKYLSNEFQLKAGTNTASGSAQDSFGGKFYADFRPGINSGGDNEKGTRWMIAYELPEAWKKDTRLKEKLEARASQLGLFAGKPGNEGGVLYTKNHKFSDYVSIEVMDFTR